MKLGAVVGHRPTVRRLAAAGLASAIFLMVLSFVFEGPAPGQSRTPPSQFLALAPGYTDEVYGMAYSFLGDVAFVGWSPPNGGSPGSFGAVVANQCTPGHSGLIRWDPTSTVLAPDGVTPIHPQVLPYLPSNTGCGMTNSSDGRIYSAISSGVSQLDGGDGRSLRVIGGPTNTLGLAIDPVTRAVTYLDRGCVAGSSGCAVDQVDPTTGKVTRFATLTEQQATFVDGISFEPEGQYLLLSARAPRNALIVVDRTGRVVQEVGLDHEPEEIVFHVDPDFALLTSTDGSLVSVEFPPLPADPTRPAGGIDYTQPPTIPLGFAMGGFRGDLAAAGPDGCMYMTQEKTRLADEGNRSIESPDSSIVRLCGDQGAFVAEYTIAEPRSAAIAYNGATTANYNDPATASAVLTENPGGAPIVGEEVIFTLNGAETCTARTDATGRAGCTITPGEPAGAYTLVARWAGDATRPAVETSTPFTVTPDETTIAYTGPTTLANANPATLSAALKEDGVAPIAGRTVTLTLGTGPGAQSCTGVTGGAGNVSCTLTVNQPLGPGTVSASFAGDAFYRPASDTKPTVIEAPEPFSVTKTATPSSMAAPGGQFTFSVVVTNTGPLPVTLALLTDDVYGDLNGKGSCVSGAVLAAGTGSYSCAFPGLFNGVAGASQTDTVTAGGTDGGGSPVTATAQATVTLTPAGPPSVTVTKVANPTTRDAPGGTFTFTAQVTNPTAEVLTITSLVDDLYGDLDAKGSCTNAVGTVLAAAPGPGNTYSCAFDGTFTGNAGGTQTDHITVGVVNPEGDRATATAEATVTLTAPPPAPPPPPPPPPPPQQPPQTTTTVGPTTTTVGSTATTRPTAVGSTTSTTRPATATTGTGDPGGAGGDDPGGGGPGGGVLDGGVAHPEAPRPRTGSEPGPALRLAAVLLLAGVGLLLAASWRRDREKEESEAAR